MNQNKKVELLAPAGDFECFMAAISAGADAVYLGGEKFGARAFANNFSQEEILQAIRVAHLFRRKIYLTVNTLVKEKEMPDLVPFLLPLYKGGLDGVIVQDIGVFQTIKEHFPELELHASTQMAITGKYGAKLLKEMGACRVVPARELSLEEIREIKEYTGLEIETFIHGAMCYGYSGLCLFSSILGGRSGNRGRCAGPCRLPYQVQNSKQVYPISLKDMYTLPLVPELIEAGIDSFKIEGRMKSPEYVAGVTSMYRKYIDRYYANPNEKFAIEKKDEALLKQLYIRSDLCQGYYHTHNGKNMVTIKEPGYSGCSEDALTQIRTKYLQTKPTINIEGKIKVAKGQKTVCTLTCGKITVTEYGETAQEASNRPLSSEDIENRMKKVGDTYFQLKKLEVENDGESFLPVKALNELRRKACGKLEEMLFGAADTRNEKTVEETYEERKAQISSIFAGVSTLEQLKTVLTFSYIQGIYLSADLFLGDNKAEITKLIENTTGIDFYVAFPHILRKRSYRYLPELFSVLQNSAIKGVLVRNLETLEWLREQNYQGEYIADQSIYCWNKKASDIWSQYFVRETQAVELNRKELLQLGNVSNKELLLYARLPLMFSANCIQNTMEHCLQDRSGKQHVYHMVDRYHNDFPVQQNCIHCYNVLYNTVPMSLHGQAAQLLKEGYAAYRLDFSLETADETRQILDYYQHLWQKEEASIFPVKDFTNGHYKRGVE